MVKSKNSCLLVLIVLPRKHSTAEQRFVSCLVTTFRRWKSPHRVRSSSQCHSQQWIGGCPSLLNWQLCFKQHIGNTMCLKPHSFKEYSWISSSSCSKMLTSWNLGSLTLVLLMTAIMSHDPWIPLPTSAAPMCTSESFSWGILRTLVQPKWRHIRTTNNSKDMGGLKFHQPPTCFISERKRRSFRIKVFSFLVPKVGPSCKEARSGTPSGWTA